MLFSGNSTLGIQTQLRFLASPFKEMVPENPGWTFLGLGLLFLFFLVLVTCGLCRLLTASVLSFNNLV